MKQHYNYKYPFLRVSIKEVVVHYNEKYHSGSDGKATAVGVCPSASADANTSAEDATTGAVPYMVLSALPVMHFDLLSRVVTI